MVNYFQIFPPLVFSYRLFIFTNRGNFQSRTVCRGKPRQRGDWTGVKWSSQSRKTNFLTLPDLAFGFVHKRSGNEIIAHPYCPLIFASLARSKNRVHVHNVRDFPQAKLDRDINVSFSLKTSSVGYLFLLH